MKYAEFVKQQYGDHIGTSSVLGQDVQLCDHMEEIRGMYYATSFVLSVTDRQALQKAGAQFGDMPDGTHAVYLTQELVAAATPARDGDEMTQAMITRTVSALEQTNAPSVKKFA